MLIIPEPKYRRRPRQRPAAPPPAALALVFASFNPGTAMLRLSFNKPVDVSGIFPGNMQVEDAAGGAKWEGVGATVIDPSTVDVEMSQFQTQAYPDTRLDAQEPTGIVAAGGGEPWAGVSHLLLPFP